MLIRFTRDFRSAATREAFYAAGEVADLEDGAQIVAEGAAEPEPAPATIAVDPSGVVLDGAAVAAAVLPGLADAVGGDTPKGKKKP